MVEEAEPSYTRALSLAPGTPLREKLKSALRSEDTAKTQMIVVLSGLLPKGTSTPEVHAQIYSHMYTSIYIYIHISIFIYLYIHIHMC